MKWGGGCRIVKAGSEVINLRSDRFLKVNVGVRLVLRGRVSYRVVKKVWPDLGRGGNCRIVQAG